MIEKRIVHIVSKITINFTSENNVNCRNASVFLFFMEIRSQNIRSQMIANVPSAKYFIRLHY